MHKESLKKIEKIKDTDPFLITITTYGKGKARNQLDTFLFVNRFPYADLEGTKQKIIELISREKSKRSE